MKKRWFACGLCLVCLVRGAGSRAADEALGSGGRGRPFGIEVVDSATGRGVPLIELETTGAIVYVTDSNGLVAFDEPGLLGTDVFFYVRGHGYEFPADGFGIRGKKLHTAPGGRARLEIKRVNIAERLYRVTGEGIYRDSVLLGAPAPIREPMIKSRVVGLDSVLCALYAGKIWWFWGDTNRPEYPLGNFNTTGATSDLPGLGGLDPSLGVELDYFENDEGFARGMAKLPGDGPTWISGAVVLRDETGDERMVAHYVKIRNTPGGGFEPYERGLAAFDPMRVEFERVTVFPEAEPFPHGGHAFLGVEDGVRWVYYADPYPLVRVPADLEAVRDPTRYEAFTCLADGVRDAANAGEDELERDASGALQWAWKANTAPVRAGDLEKLIRAGRLRREESPFAIRDPDTGRAVVVHRGSVYWNDYRRRWILIAGEIGGSSSLLGEIWYAEADRPLGPWVFARKVVTHDRYTFYNPVQHPFFDADGGRRIYFEGTYTTSFSGNPVKTPRYDYNQILYRLDLEDSRLNLPVAIYEIRESDGILLDYRIGAGPETSELPIAFWALDRPGPRTVAVARTLVGGRAVLEIEPLDSTSGEANEGERSSAAFFHALPADASDAPATTVPLWELQSRSGARVGYIAAEKPSPGPDSTVSPRPIARVWLHPLENVPSGGFVRPAESR